MSQDICTIYILRLFEVVSLRYHCLDFISEAMMLRQYCQLVYSSLDFAVDMRKLEVAGIGFFSILIPQI